MALIIITPPAIEPVSVAEVLDAARIDGTDYDSQAAIAIKAVRKNAEARLGRFLISQTVERVLDAFPSVEIDLNVPNVQSITSLKYYDTAGVEQTMASNLYSLDSASIPCWLLPAYGTAWPATYDMANALRVRFVAGYGSLAADVEEDIRLWIITRCVQVLNSPDGLTDANISSSNFIDGLLDAHIVYGKL